MGEGEISKLTVALAQRLDKDKVKKLAAKLLRQSAATQLVEVIVHIAGACEVGNHSSTGTTRECTEHSAISADDYRHACGRWGDAIG